MNKYFVTVDGEAQEVDVKKESVFDYVIPIKATNGETLGYTVTHKISFYSGRYKKWVIIEVGDVSDGATSAPDIDSFGWLLHDDVCNTGKFSDGSPCNNWKASSVLSDVFKDEGRWLRARTWFIATYTLGGGKARDNGMF